VQNDDGTESYEVEDLANRRHHFVGKGRDRRIVWDYYVKWRGYPSAANLWLTEDSLRNNANVLT